MAEGLGQAAQSAQLLGHLEHLWFPGQSRFIYMVNINRESMESNNQQSPRQIDVFNSIAILQTMLLPGQSKPVVAVEQHCVPSPALSIVLYPSSAGPGCADGGHVLLEHSWGVAPSHTSITSSPAFSVLLPAMLEVHQLLNCVYDLKWFSIKICN